jgi:hypothetical protein
MRRIITGVYNEPIDRNAPTLPPPSAQQNAVGGGLRVESQPLSLRGFVPVCPTPRRLIVKSRKR